MSALHPEARALLDMIHRVGAPPFHTLAVGQAREAFRRLQAYGRPPAPAVAMAHDLVIPRFEPGGGELPARCYRPQGVAARARLPLVLYFHGGGWTVGDIDCYDVLCRQLCSRAGVAVLSIGYRLAPEHPFPAATDDALLALRWVATHAETLGVDGSRLAVAGDSAGGNLAIVAALEARDRGGPRLAFQLLFYPSTDQSGTHCSHERYGRGFGLDRDTILWFQDHYLPDRHALLDWRASPLRAASFAGLPPALVITAECDPLVDDCALYARALDRAGVPVAHSCYPGMIHGFVTLGRLFPAADAAVSEASRALARALGGAT